jgi:hypothetical protein
LFNIFLDYLARKKSQEKPTKRIQIRKESVMLSLLAGGNVHVILLLKNSKVSTIKPLDVIKTKKLSAKVQDTKSPFNNPFLLYVPIINMPRKKSGKQSHSQ